MKSPRVQPLAPTERPSQKRARSTTDTARHTRYCPTIPYHSAAMAASGSGRGTDIGTERRRVPGDEGETICSQFRAFPRKCNHARNSHFSRAHPNDDCCSLLVGLSLTARLTDGRRSSGTTNRGYSWCCAWRRYWLRTWKATAWHTYHAPIPTRHISVMAMGSPSANLPPPPMPLIVLVHGSGGGGFFRASHLSFGRSIKLSQGGSKKTHRSEINFSRNCRMSSLRQRLLASDHPEYPPEPPTRQGAFLS